MMSETETCVYSRSGFPRFACLASALRGAVRAPVFEKDICGTHREGALNPPPLPAGCDEPAEGLAAQQCVLGHLKVNPSSLVARQISKQSPPRGANHKVTSPVAPSGTTAGDNSSSHGPPKWQPWKKKEKVSKELSGTVAKDAPSTKEGTLFPNLEPASSSVSNEADG